MKIIIIIVIIIISITLIRRFKKRVSGSLLNPLFYLLIFSILYLLLPLLYIEYTLTVLNWNVDPSIINKACFWSLWYICIFYIFYLYSKDHIYTFSDFSPTPLTVQYSLVINWIIIITLIFIILFYVPTIYSLKADREAALQYYESYVNMPFKLRILMYCHFATIFILFWKYKKYIYLLPCLLYFIIDNSHGGRTSSVMTFIFVYFIIVVYTKKTFLIPALSCVIIFILVGLLQRSSSPDFLWNLYMSGAEFSNTYLTTIYLLEHPDYTLDGTNYCLVSFSKIIPGGIVDKMLYFGEWYGNQLSSDIGLGYGLAGNLITEALVYGGKLFALLHPILIGTTCLLLNRMKYQKNLFTILLLIFICISMQNIARSYFWGFILYPFQILLFFLFWLKNDYFKQVFK